MSKETKNEVAVTKASTPENQLLQIEPLIRTIRGQQVLLDSDLAVLYGVETKQLNQQVKRNIERFPADFMFQLTKEELGDLKSQIVISNTFSDSIRSQNATINRVDNSLRSQIVTIENRGRHTKYLPYAFTENGIAMLSSVLRSQTAIQVNIRIMRAFNAMRHFIASNAKIFQRLDVMEQNQQALAAHQTETDHKLEEVFRLLDNGIAQPQQGIFFDGQIFDAYTFINERIREAKEQIVLIDNYIDDSVLTMLDKRSEGVSAKIYTKKLSAQLLLDIQKHNAQYAPIDVVEFDRAHDRFLCVDETVYHIGASIKDLGKKWFAFNRMEWTTTELMKRI